MLSDESVHYRDLNNNLSFSRTLEYFILLGWTVHKDFSYSILYRGPSTLWTWIITCPFYGLQNISSSWEEPSILLDFLIDLSTYWTNILTILGWIVHKDFSYFILHGRIRLVCELNNISSFLDEFIYFMDLIKFHRKKY